MKITFLGTACATAGAERDNTYFIMQHNDSFTLVDVGGSPLSKLQKLNVSLHDIDQVIFTHFHIDHIYGLPSLLWGMWLNERKKPLKIYCSSDNRDTLNQWLRVMDVKGWPVKFPIEIITYNWTKETKLIETEGFVVSTFQSLHIGPTVGLKIRVNEKHVVYSADTTVNPAIMLEEHIDMLIHEATSAINPLPNHTSLKQLLDLYPLHKIDEIIAVHLTESEPYDAVLEQYNSEVSKKIKLGYDLMELNIS